MPEDSPYYTNVDVTVKAAQFRSRGFFDIQSNTINTTTVTDSQVAPSVRYWHTVTPSKFPLYCLESMCVCGVISSFCVELVPKTGKVLMYGGVFNQIGEAKTKNKKKSYGLWHR
jgi:hypothetical protein